jgi:hypothetical protein
VAFEAGVIDWLPVRGFHHGPRRQERPEKRPQIRLQSVLLAITPSASDSAPGGDDELTTTSHLTEKSRYALFDGVLRSSNLVGLSANGRDDCYVKLVWSIHVIGSLADEELDPQRYRELTMRLKNATSDQLPYLLCLELGGKGVQVLPAPAVVNRTLDRRQFPFATFKLA